MTIFDLAGKETQLAELQKQTNRPGFWQDNEKAQEVLTQIKNLNAVVESWKEILHQVEENLELAQLFAEEETEEQEIKELSQTTKSLEEQFLKLELQTILSNKDDIRNCYLEIHPGAGGTESCDWASILMRMYLRWCEEKNFKTRTVDLQPEEEAGIKSATIHVEGAYAYGFLKAEHGVHRLVRISPFDANRRRHTSFAAVFVSPEVEQDIEIDIQPADLRIETFRASGHGGQHVNVTDSAVRITHLPTGIVVQCQNERSQHRNKASAMNVLRSRLYQHYLEERRREQEKVQVKKDISWGNQIRSYVFHPYNLVKDHRTGVENSNVQAVMDGQLDGFIEAYLKGKMKTNEK